MEAKLSLEALKASVLPTLDIAIPQGTGPTKFKRVRQPAGAASNPSSASPPSHASAINTTIATTTTTTTAAAAAAATTETSNVEMKTAPTFNGNTPAMYSVTASATGKVAAPSTASFKKQAPRQFSKPVPDDLQAAAAAIFAPLTPVATPDFSSESAAVAHLAVAKAPGQESDESNKKKRRRKGKNNNSNNNNSNQPTEGSAAKETVTERVEKAGGASASKKQKMNNVGSTPPTTTAKKSKDPNTISAAAKKRAKVRVIKLARSLDAQPELVGLSATPEDDFDTLLNQHYEHTNKMLQRDMEEETRKAEEQIKKQQRELAALTAQMMLEVEAASNPTPSSGTPATSTQGATKLLDGGKKTGTTGSNPKEKQPFVPRRDCMYYIKGRCFKDKECTFRHDPSAIQTAEPQVQVPKIESEEVRRSRGVCRFHKTGCCTRGDYCRQSHNLKSEPCSFYHLQGQCSRGDECQFGHTPIGPEEHQALVADVTAKMKRKAEALAAHQALDAEIASRMSNGSHGTQGLFI